MLTTNELRMIICSKVVVKMNGYYNIGNEITDFANSRAETATLLRAVSFGYTGYDNCGFADRQTGGGIK